jgi:hypothetical protein
VLRSTTWIFKKGLTALPKTPKRSESPPERREQRIRTGYGTSHPPIVIENRLDLTAPYSALSFCLKTGQSDRFSESELTFPKLANLTYDQMKRSSDSLIGANERGGTVAVTITKVVKPIREEFQTRKTALLPHSRL